jgi:hypothetical protein
MHQQQALTELVAVNDKMSMDIDLFNMEKAIHHDHGSHLERIYQFFCIRFSLLNGRNEGNCQPWSMYVHTYLPR